MNQLNYWTRTEDEGKAVLNKKLVGIVGDKVVYTEVEAKATIQSFDPANVKKPQFDNWNNFVAEWRNKNNLSMQSIEQMSFAWVWMVSENAFVSSAIQGIAISMAFALVVLIGATMNILLAFYAIFAVAYIVVTVVSIMVLKEW